MTAAVSATPHEAVAGQRRSARRGRLAIVAAAAAWSTAGLGQRELDVSPAAQVAGRALFAALALLLLVWATDRRGPWAPFRELGRWGAAATVLLGVSSGTFMLALNHTTVANVLFLQAAAPVMAALLGWWLVGDAITPRTGVAMAVAAVGVSLMVAGSLSAGVLALLLPLAMTASFAGVIVVARHRREVSLLPAPFASFAAAGGRDWAILAALGAGQIGLGLALLTVGARLIPPAEVALISLLGSCSAPSGCGWPTARSPPAPRSRAGRS